MNPYIAHPDHIPKDDRYADLPLYGRYYPRPDDFRIDVRHANSTSPESLRYWEAVLGLYPNEGRDVFAVGSLIVKSSHRHESAKVDYTYADANEVQAINIAKRVFRGIRVPDIYFSGKINGRPVLVQERLPGVSLEVAWPYLSEDQKASFKIQARMMLRQMHAIKAPSSRRMQDHIVPDPSILTNGRLNPQEAQILFSANLDQDLGFMHNDLTPSNCIVDDDKIVGLIDWEMAGYLGWKTAGEIHRRIRCPQREHFVCANVSEERLQGIMWWNDIYDGEMP
ncbi:kinase-like protein [Trichoderma longibrachiatum ATCC 18648]|uniref:non-specific serine/threonine protein kinase n=1 Tax=Trichoderma longibrachiatum ATCC 18648 TaxID=983965 RepID=A0A2T4CJQ8_TRILO|nr:kinase-like protein [Trichoderma longibrachiatum ATCC 18648]